MSEHLPNGYKVCPNCNAMIDEDWQLCPMCPAPSDISLTVLPDGALVEDRRNNISELALISERSLLLTCPFTGATSLVHTQAQVDAYQRVQVWHVTALRAEMDALRAENAQLKTAAWAVLEDDDCDSCDGECGNRTCAYYRLRVLAARSNPPAQKEQP